MSSISTYTTTVTTHYITHGEDEFETLYRPAEGIDPHVEFSGERALVRYAVCDEDATNPREDYDHFATLVQQDSSLADVDQPDLDIAEANDYFDDKSKIQRYVSIFRPDILHYADYVTIGGGYGYAYITEDDMFRAGFSTIDPGGPEEFARKARQIIEDELDEYEAWAAGEVYGVAEETYHHDGDGSWVRNGGEDIWGFIGDEYAQRIVNEGY